MCILFTYVDIYINKMVEIKNERNVTILVEMTDLRNIKLKYDFSKEMT